MRYVLHVCYDKELTYLTVGEVINRYFQNNIGPLIHGER